MRMARTAFLRTILILLGLFLVFAPTCVYAEIEETSSKTDAAQVDKEPLSCVSACMEESTDSLDCSESCIEIAEVTMCANRS